MPDICNFLLDQSSLEGSPTAKGPHRKNTQCFLVIKIVLGWAAPVLSLYLVTVNAYCGICCSLLFSFQYVILILSTTSGYPCVHPKHAVSQSLPRFSFSLFFSSFSCINCKLYTCLNPSISLSYSIFCYSCSIQSYCLLLETNQISVTIYTR